MTTSPIVSFGSNELTIRDDTSFSLFAGVLQSFSDFDDISQGTSVTKPYATYEPDYWLLDGNYKFMPATNIHVGIMGNTLSTSPNGDFAALIDITIDFSVVHSTSGLSFLFSYSGDWMDTITVAFYNNSFALIRSDVYNPTGTTFSTNQAISNFRRIHILLNSTNKVSRYPRISRIDFDTLTRFTGADIKAARVVEEINPLSVELPINTLELTLFSSVGAFSIVNPTGVYASLQYKEPLDVHEDMNGEMIYIGRFYLDKWESLSENEATFEASDAIGLLDKPIFYGGWWFGSYVPSSILSEDLIEKIMGVAGISYELDASLEGIQVTGLMHVQTCREALQMVAFDIGAYITCARSNVVQIRPLELASGLTVYDYNLTSAEKGIASPLTLKPLITGVEISEYSYIENPVSDIEFFNQSLAVGDHLIIPNFIVVDLLIDGSTATFTFDADYSNTPIFVAVVTGVGTVILTATSELKETAKVKGIYNLSLPANTPPNILTIDSATLIMAADSTTITQRVYDYYQQRYLQKTKLFASFISPGDSVLVNVQSSRQLKGIVEKMSTDLAGGYISDVEITGVIVPL